MGYRLWDPALRKIIRSNDVIFNENCMHKQPTKVEEVRRVVFREDVTYGQPRRPNVQQPLHAENGAENQPIGAENQPQEVAIDAPQEFLFGLLMPNYPAMVLYTLPDWAEFEMGLQPVFWETQSGKPPTSGEEVTIFFNPTATELVPNVDYGIAFNGGFNQPIMCGGEPRIMTRRDRGPACDPFFSIKINVPVHALTLEFSFTDGKTWDGPYKLKFQVPKNLKNQPLDFFSKGLAEELSKVGACDSAIYPDAAFIENRCLFPASLIHEGGKSCDLDIFPGCMDPDSPNYDPLATVDDGSCPYISSDED
ncbi:hypothetical protein L7F22_007134 [Adiantum nelumboides]|nr:hypothetical protein [Adiantum nelumboides]